VAAICAVTREINPAGARVGHGSLGRTAVDTRTSIEEILLLEATEPATGARRARIDREHYDGPTSMERLQAHHDRMDKLARVHTRLPEQIMLDSALVAERLQHEGGDHVDGLAQTALSGCQ
jgi:hypothetical protein